MAAVVYEVGDIVTLKKVIHVRQQRMGNLKVGADFRFEMYGAVDIRSWYRGRW